MVMFKCVCVCVCVWCQMGNGSHFHRGPWWLYSPRMECKPFLPIVNFGAHPFISPHRKHAKNSWWKRRRFPKVRKLVVVGLTTKITGGGKFWTCEKLLWNTYYCRHFDRWFGPHPNKASSRHLHLYLLTGVEFKGRVYFSLVVKFLG